MQTLAEAQETNRRLHRRVQRLERPLEKALDKAEKRIADEKGRAEYFRASMIREREETQAMKMSVWAARIWSFLSWGILFVVGIWHWH